MRKRSSLCLDHPERDRADLRESDILPLMLKAIEGRFRDGKIELLEPPPTQHETRVLVTFLPSGGEVDLADRGIDVAQARDLRARLGAFAEDWNRPEMDVYDEG